MFAAFINALKLTLPKTVFSYKLFKFGYYPPCLFVHLSLLISSFLFFLFHYYIVCYKINLQKSVKRKYFYFSFR